MTSDPIQKQTPDSLLTMLAKTAVDALVSEYARRRGVGHTSNMIRLAKETGGDIVAASEPEADRIRGMMPMGGSNPLIVSLGAVRDLIGRGRRPVYVDHFAVTTLAEQVAGLCRQACAAWWADQRSWENLEAAYVAEAQMLRVRIGKLEDALLEGREPESEPTQDNDATRRAAAWYDAFEVWRPRVAEDGDVWNAVTCSLYEIVSDRISQIDGGEEWRYATPDDVIEAIKRVVAVKDRIKWKANQ